MQFDSLAFVAFFTIVAALYWSSSGWTWRKNLLLIASYLFYAGWNPYFLPLLIATSFFDWRLALMMHNAITIASRRAWLTVICLVNLSVLAYFKYANFLIDNGNHALTALGLPVWEFQSSVALPIGISFYTFHSLSYCVDIYRGNVNPTSSWRDYLLYVAFFPQLVAGPIVRWTTMGKQIETPRAFNAHNLGLGFSLMLVGLFQKVVLADAVFAPAANNYFGQTALETGLFAWIGALAFTGQIFCDFAGYTTCAIGAALVLGFKLPVNFQAPYAARGFSDFWRRWHISLSSWLRDYLYIPLGGNRGSWLFTSRNLLLTMLLGGLWHGAAWTFVVWGILHGAVLMVERAMRPISGEMFRRIPRIASFLGWLITFLGVVVAWVFFRAEDLPAALHVVRMMFDAGAYSVVALEALSFDDGLIMFMLAILICLQNAFKDVPLTKLLSSMPWPVLGVLIGCMLVLISTASGEGNAFIYFQF